MTPDPNPAAPNPPTPAQPPQTPADPKAPRPSDPQQPQTPPVDPEAIRKAAKEEARRELEAELEKERKEAEAKAAREQGKFRELYEAEQAAAKAAKEEAAAAALSLRKEQVHGRLRDYLAANHADYSAAAKYMMPLLTVEAKTSDEDADKAIAAVVKQYVADNPRSAKGAAAPAAPAHGQRLPADRRPQNGHQKARSEVALRHF